MTPEANVPDVYTVGRWLRFHRWLTREVRAATEVAATALRAGDEASAHAALEHAHRCLSVRARVNATYRALLFDDVLGRWLRHGGPSNERGNERGGV